jgi:predicted ribosomally synthesized peptide with nif11-like leader
MSIQAALDFMRRVRDDEALRREVEALGPEAGLAAVVALAIAAGYAFTEAELRAAHRADWGLRLIHFGRPDDA